MKLFVENALKSVIYKKRNHHIYIPHAYNNLSITNMSWNSIHVKTLNDVPNAFEGNVVLGKYFDLYKTGISKFLSSWRHLDCDLR